MAVSGPQSTQSDLIVREARTADEMNAVFGLRYSVFVEEMGGDGPGVDHAARLERDRYDDFARHLMLVDKAQDGRVLGTFRFMDQDGAARAGGFYTSGEYDLSALFSTGLGLLECGRSCLHASQRGGAGMHLLWQALARKVVEAEAQVLFGVASFPGRDPAPHLAAISYLHNVHLAPEALRPMALHPVFSAGQMQPEGAFDRLDVMRAMPALIKAYLRLGGMIGQGAFVDSAFNTTDVCMVLPVDRIPPAQRARLLA